MKKTILSIGALIGGLVVAGAQGTINFYNVSSAYAISTNGPSGSGLISTSAKSPNGYYFALLLNTSSSTDSDPLSAGWEVATSSGADVIANNTSVAGGFGNLGKSTAVDQWTPGAVMSYEIVGWSASLGNTWSDIVSQLTNGKWVDNGFFGISSIGAGKSGGDASSGVATPPQALFNKTGGIASGWDLNVVAVPEPTTIALAGLGAISLLGLRRKK